MKAEKNNGYLRASTIVTEQSADLPISRLVGQETAPTVNPLQVYKISLNSTFFEYHVFFLESIFRNTQTNLVSSESFLTK